MFFYKVKGHMPKLSSFGRGKTIRPKKSLTSLLHAALQLYAQYEIFSPQYLSLVGFLAHNWVLWGSPCNTRDFDTLIKLFIHSAYTAYVDQMPDT